VSRLADSTNQVISVRKSPYLHSERERIEYNLPSRLKVPDLLFRIETAKINAVRNPPPVLLIRLFELFHLKTNF
jgi:hypothetical protein